jgi:SulP family sulfate permease
MIEGLAQKARKRGVALWLTGARRDVRRVFLTHGLRKPLVRYASTVENALRAVHNGDAPPRREARADGLARGGS